MGPAKAAGGPSAWRRFASAGGVGSVLLLAGFYAVALAMDLWPIDPLRYRLGQYVPADIYPRVRFKIPLPSLVEEKKRSIMRTTPATFVFNSELADRISATLSSLPDRLAATTQPSAVEQELQKQFGFTQADLDAWRSYAVPAKRQELARQVEKFRKALVQTYIVRADECETQRERARDQLVENFRAVHDGVSEVRKISSLISMADTDSVKMAALRLASEFDPRLADTVKSYLVSVLGGGVPTYSYDAAATDKERSEALAALEVKDPDKLPEEVKKEYGPNDVLVSGSRLAGPSARTVALSADDLALLRQEHRYFTERLRTDRPFLWAARIAGRAATLLMITVLMGLFVARFRPSLARDHRQGAVLAVTLLVFLGAGKLLTGPQGWGPQAALLPVLMAALVLVIVYNPRFAWAMSLIFCLFVILQVRGAMDVFSVFLLAVTAAVFQLREIRSRSKLIVSAIATAAVAMAAQFAAGAAALVPMSFVWKDAAVAGVAVVLAGFLSLGLLPLFEWMFGVATSMTLLEWADANKPILKRLAMEAPGTYNHSLQLGVLCEAAAEAIKARGLLARVGAYYHDIGKVNKPDYFVENQAGSPSRHAKLSPAMSMLIITGHVKDGLELARQYRVPRVLHEFIATHHGTTLVQYFYHAAAEQRKAEADRAPDEVVFRYGGPKPRSKEAAILMLADASESSVRSMPEPTPGRIENQVHTMVMRRLMDGQLDECDLMLREVHQIEASLVKSLTSMYHLRIAYPTPAGQTPSAAEMASQRNGETVQENGERPARHDGQPAEAPP
ncbi:MAG: HD family phosphohydrolase [Phycisphaerae bacterium]